MSVDNYFGKVLIIAAHADDETLGCGGIITKLRSNNNDCHIHVVTGYGQEKHPFYDKKTFEIVRKEFKNAINHIGSPSYSFGNLPAAKLNDIPTYHVNNEIKNIIERIKPNTILLPSRDDLHLDHKIINYSVRVASRPYLKNNVNLFSLIEYEVPSETNIFFDNINEIYMPNLFIDITDFITNKIRGFSEYKSQSQESNQPRSLTGIKTLAKYRGLNIGVDYAESFRIILKKYI